MAISDFYIYFRTGILNIGKQNEAKPKVSILSDGLGC
jgi:hypothetical protein